VQISDRHALVVIDMQVALVRGAYREREILASLCETVRKARDAGMPVLFVQHNHATFKPMFRCSPGWQVHPALEPADKDLRIEKTACDAFYDTPLQTMLSSLGVDTVILAGMQSEYCVDTTARSALNHGFDVVLLSDCHTTGDDTFLAEDIIAHHNTVLANVVHPDHHITVVTSNDLSFRA
jgi:nicotinamidase-related amidase